MDAGLDPTVTRLGQHCPDMEQVVIPGAAPAGGSFLRNVSAVLLGPPRTWLGGQINNEDIRSSITGASRIDHPTFANFIMTFELLYKALEENRSKAKIIQNINASLAAISSLIGICSPTTRTAEITREIHRHLAEVFRIPQERNVAPLTAILNELDLWNAHLTNLNAYLEGKDEAHACTKTFLRRLLQETRLKLFHAEGANATGFLNYLRHIKEMQYGHIAGGLNALIESVGILFQRTITARFNGVAGTSFGVPGVFDLEDDPSIPGLERLADGTIQRHARANSTSVFDVVTKLFGAFRVGEDPRNTKWRISLLIPILEFIRTQILESNRSGGAGTFPEGALASLNESLRILVSLQSTDLPPEDVQRRFGTVKDNLDTCLIGVLRYLPYLPLSTILGLDSLPEDGLGGDPVSELQATLQDLQALQTTTRPEIDERTLYEEAFSRFKQTASWMTAYKAISWFIGEIPDYVIQRPQTFPQIMAKIYHPDGSLAVADPVRQHEIFIDALLQNVDASSHLFVLTRFFLRLLVPLVVHISNFTILRVVSGGKQFLDGQLASAHSSATGQSSTTLLDLFSDTAQAYTNAHQMAARPENLGATRASEVIDHFFYRDPNRRFLRGHENKASVYANLGEAIIDEFLASIDFTTTLANINAQILEWSIDSNWLIIQSIFWVATLPIRTTLATINTVIFWPLQAIANTILYYTARAVVSRTNLVEQLTNLTLNSLTKTTDFTTTLDELVLDLLKMLWELLQAPSDGTSSFSDLQTTPETTAALSKALSTLIEAVNIGNRQNTQLDIQNQLPLRGGDITAILSQLGLTLRRASLDGVSQLLDRSWQLLLQRGTKLSRLLLNTLNRSMLSNGQKLRGVALPEDARARQTKDLTEHHIKLLIWEAVKLATTHLTASPNEAGAINAHTQTIRNHFGFTFTDPADGEGVQFGVRTLTRALRRDPPSPFEFESKLTRWHETLRQICEGRNQDPMRALRALHAEFSAIATLIQHTLSTMESEDSERSALDAHEKNLLPITRALREFNTHFFTIYDLVQKTTCLHKDQLNQAATAAQHIEVHALRLANTIELFPRDFGPDLETWKQELNRCKAAIQAGRDYLNRWFNDIRGPLPGLTNAAGEALQSLDAATSVVDSLSELKRWTEVTLFPPIESQTHPSLLSQIERCIQARTPRQLKGIMNGLLQSLRTLLPAHQIQGSLDQINYEVFEKLIRENLHIFESNGDLESSMRQAATFTSQLRDFVLQLDRAKVAEAFANTAKAKANLNRIGELAANESRTLAPLNTRMPLPLNEATQALQALERGVKGLKTVNKLTIGTVDKMPFVPMAQRAVYKYIKGSLQKALAQLLADPNFLEGYAIRSFIDFLEKHGKDHKDEMRLPL